MSNQLFQRLVSESGLSPLFAAHALKRACTRAGVDPSRLSPGDLRVTLPEIQRTLETFFDTEAPEVIERIVAMADVED